MASTDKNLGNFLEARTNRLDATLKVLTEELKKSHQDIISMNKRMNSRFTQVNERLDKIDVSLLGLRTMMSELKLDLSLHMLDHTKPKRGFRSIWMIGLWN